MNQQTPLVCNMDVFTAAERNAHIHNSTQLIQVIRSVREFQDGYEFTLPGEAQTIFRIAEFISRERLCCPFLEFTLRVVPNNEAVTLSLMGPVGTPEFLRLEFEGAFQ